MNSKIILKIKYFIIYKISLAKFSIVARRIKMTTITKFRKMELVVENPFNFVD